MRTFIKTYDAQYVDAATMTDVITSGSDGGTVGIISQYASGASISGRLVARIGPKPVLNESSREVISAADREARKRQAGVVAANLIHAICRADALAKRDGNGAVIHFDPDTTRWVITDLGKTATAPAFSHP
ncbi:hypothetical protein [Arthrobacter sp. MAHUQ-56]